MNELTPQQIAEGWKPPPEHSPHWAAIPPEKPEFCSFSDWQAVLKGHLSISHPAVSGMPPGDWCSDERSRCEWLIRKKAEGYNAPIVAQEIDKRRHLLPQVASADDYSKVEPGRAYVTTADSAIRWKPAA